jgi:hypothetical protein
LDKSVSEGYGVLGRERVGRVGRGRRYQKEPQMKNTLLCRFAALALTMYGVA